MVCKDNVRGRSAIAIQPPRSFALSWSLLSISWSIFHGAFRGWYLLVYLNHPELHILQDLFVVGLVALVEFPNKYEAISWFVTFSSVLRTVLVIKFVLSREYCFGDIGVGYDWPLLFDVSIVAGSNELKLSLNSRSCLAMDTIKLRWSDARKNFQATSTIAACKWASFFQSEDWSLGKVLSMLMCIRCSMEKWGNIPKMTVWSLIRGITSISLKWPYTN